MINVLHVTEDHSFQNTGISNAVDGLTRSVPDVINPAIACVGAETLPVRKGVRLYVMTTSGLAKVWRYAPGQDTVLSQAVKSADIVHLHGLWMWIQWAAVREASRQSKPVILTPHGMLEPWIWARQSWPHRLKKTLYWNGIAFPAFRGASVIHALTSYEAVTLAGYFPGKRQVVIPHGINLQAEDQALAQLQQQDKDSPPYFLFVGRLHPVKAIHLLIRAFAQLGDDRFLLKIAGPTQTREQAYADGLHKLVSELGLQQRVTFMGEVQGSIKWQLYRDAWAVCLPSFSEVIGLVNLEAAAAGTPVITTRETGVTEDWDLCGGLFIDPEEGSILSGLQKAIAWTPAERWTRGQSLRGLVEAHYLWERIGQQWAEVYLELSGGSQHG
jgi:glycosyltransferase involved in cell wall biosynthesis